MLTILAERGELEDREGEHDGHRNETVKGAGFESDLAHDDSRGRPATPVRFRPDAGGTVSGKRSI